MKDKKKFLKENDSKESNELLFWIILALGFLMPFALILPVNPVTANGNPGGCGPLQVEELETTPYRWTPLLIGHAPYYDGECNAHVDWSSTTSAYAFPMEYTTTKTRSVSISIQNGNTGGIFERAKWTIYHWSKLYCGGGYTAKVKSGNWHDDRITKWLYGYSKMTDADDITQFSYDGYDSVYLDHRYHAADFVVDTQAGPGYTEHTGGGTENLFGFDFSVGVEYVSTGVFSAKAVQDNDWEWEYYFPSGHKWDVDVIDELWTFRAYSCGGGGCPYIAPWNGYFFDAENNLLRLSESSPSVDVEDWYLIQQQLPMKDGYYAFQIQEFENEESLFDCIKLYTVDHLQAFKVGVRPTGEVIPYKEPRSPLSATDSGNNDVLPLIQCEGDDIYEGDTGEWLLLNFGSIRTQAANLILNSDDIIKSPCLDIHVNNGAGWQPVTTIIPRVKFATDVIDLSDYIEDPSEDFMVRIDLSASHKIDYIGLETLPIPSSVVEIKEAPLKIGAHIVDGDVTEKLLTVDSDCVLLSIGYDIRLFFDIPRQNPGFQRDLLFYAYGQYYTVNEE